LFLILSACGALLEVSGVGVMSACGTHHTHTTHLKQSANAKRRECPDGMKTVQDDSQERWRREQSSKTYTSCYIPKSEHVHFWEYNVFDLDCQGEVNMFTSS